MYIKLKNQCKRNAVVITVLYALFLVWTVIRFLRGRHWLIQLSYGRLGYLIQFAGYLVMLIEYAWTEGIINKEALADGERSGSWSSRATITLRYLSTMGMLLIVAWFGRYAADYADRTDTLLGCVKYVGMMWLKMLIVNSFLYFVYTRSCLMNEQKKIASQYQVEAEAIVAKEREAADQAEKMLPEKERAALLKQKREDYISRNPDPVHAPEPEDWEQADYYIPKFPSKEESAKFKKRLLGGWAERYAFATGEKGADKKLYEDLDAFLEAAGSEAGVEILIRNPAVLHSTGRSEVFVSLVEINLYADLISLMSEDEIAAIMTDPVAPIIRGLAYRYTPEYRASCENGVLPTLFGEDERSKKIEITFRWHTPKTPEESALRPR